MSYYGAEKVVARYNILPWCGKEATEAYRTKTKGRPPSPAADQVLATDQSGLLGHRR